jgi:iron complex transport system ATP-binding protein
MMARYPYLSPFSSFGSGDKEAVFAALDEAQIQIFADRRMSELSGGERQKVYLASALAQGVKILLLDEPTTFLDPKHVTEIQKLLLRANRERGMTVIAVTHDINRAVLMSERIVALKDGGVAFDGSSFDFMQSAVLERIYLKSFLFAHHPQNGKMIVVPECAE